MIDFTHAFDTAWERMMVILFRPFDFGKWCAIGFSAFLAGLMHGGNGFNSSFNTNDFNPNKFQPNSTTTTTKSIDFGQLHSEISSAFSNAATLGMITLIIVIFVAVIALTLLILWLGARGQFLLLDNITRNRGAIAWPWNAYARQANSLFGFYLLLTVLSFLLILPILIVAVVLAIPIFQQNRWPVGGEIAGFVVLGLIYFIVGIAVSILLFVFREFGTAIMFRQNLLAREAFFASMRLIGQHPASVCVFILLRMAIFIGVAVISVIICCGTCCIGALPYVGTVFLLPALIFVRCFSLDCLSQFGMEYDAFSVDARPAFTGQGIPPIHPQQPG